jgi:hypothetical protein
MEMEIKFKKCEKRKFFVNRHSIFDFFLQNNYSLVNVFNLNQYNTSWSEYRVFRKCLKL